ncbi:MAG TPA: aminotransferase class I/II-fold pyridoxal phosphate-dependent enzyme [Fastidiosipila sp.]|nr:aminotransferase class I/II-fold pyridoxal phosphate-dependent enzyme [Fastidiosipila sp.]
MRINDFALEVYFGKYEFSAPYLLAQSDCETMTIDALLDFEPGAKDSFLEMRLGYSEVAGDPELRSLIAALYEEKTVDDVLTHCGAQEAIFAFMNTHVSSGDHIIYMSPTYQSLYSIAASLGAEPSAWPLKNLDGVWKIDIAELESLIRPSTTMIVLNTPNNPTGFTFSEEEMRQISDIAAKHDLHIFADEVYKGLELEDDRRPWFSDLYGKAISLGVMSKAYGLAGLRIGWVVTKDHAVLDKMTRFKHYLSICNTTAGEYLAKIALKHGDSILQKNREIIEGNVALANKFFERYAELFDNYPPVSGPIAFHRLRFGMSSDDFCEQLVKDAGVLLLPGSVFDVTEPYVRMGYGRKNFSDNLAELNAYLQKHPFSAKGGSA